MKNAFISASHLLSRHWWLLIALFAAVYGCRTADAGEFSTIAAAPFTVSLPADMQFLYESPLTFLLGAYYLRHGLAAATTFLLVHAMGLALFLAALRKALAHQVGDDAPGTAIIIMLSSPLLFIVLSWFGKSDPYLLGFFFLLTATASPLTQVILSVLMVLCHREMGAVVLIAHICLRPRTWQTIGLGILLGEAALLVHLHLLLSAVPTSRSAYALSHGFVLLDIFWSHPVLHLATTFGPFWLYVVTRKTMTNASVLVLAAALVLAAFSYDFTRVFVITSVPVMLEITRDVVSDIKQRGGIMLGRRCIDVNGLWPLMFVQAQLFGAAVLLPRGVEVVLRPR
jgi:hypothetical protein